MFKEIADFTGSFAFERENTLKYLRALTDASLDQPVADGHWTLGQIAWHITTTIPEMMGRTGIEVTSLDHQALRPQSAAAIADAYDAASAELLTAVTDGWTDATLAVEDDMYGEQWKRGMTLGVLLSHQTHHRGQLSVLMRQAGVVVPGIYGPAKEDWAKFGAAPPEN